MSVALVQLTLASASPATVLPPLPSHRCHFPVYNLTSPAYTSPLSLHHHREDPVTYPFTLPFTSLHLTIPCLAILVSCIPFSVNTSFTTLPPPWHPYRYPYPARTRLALRPSSVNTHTETPGNALLTHDTRRIRASRHVRPHTLKAKSEPNAWRLKDKRGR